MAAIRLGYDTALARHFDGNHKVEDDLKCGILKHNIEWNVLKRKQQEGELIKKLNTLEPRGLNISGGVKTKRIVMPFIEIDLMKDRMEIPDGVTMVYKNDKNLKRKMLNNTKKKITT